MSSSIVLGRNYAIAGLSGLTPDGLAAFPDIAEHIVTTHDESGDANTYMIDPNLYQMANGKWLLTYGSGSGHVSLDDKVVGKFSDDLVNWGAEFAINEDTAEEIAAANGGPRGIVGGVTSTGRVVMFHCVKNISNHQYSKIARQYSDDHGVTWSSERDLTLLFNSALDGDKLIPFGRMFENGNGELVQLVNTDLGKARVIFSSDNGDFWNTKTTVFDSAANYIETNLIKIDDDRFVILFRNNSSPNVYGYAKSSDGCHTWTAPTGGIDWRTAADTDDTLYPSPINGLTVGDKVYLSWGPRKPYGRLYLNVVDKEAFWTNPGIGWDGSIESPNRRVIANSRSKNGSTNYLNFGYPTLHELPGHTDKVAITWYEQADTDNTNHTEIRLMTVSEGTAFQTFAPQVYLASSQTNDGFSYGAEPQLFRMANGNILYIWWHGNSHTENNGILYAKVVDDNLNEIVPRFVLADDVQPYDTRNAAGGVTDTGRIVIYYRVYSPSGTTTIDVMRMYSDDNAATWSTPTSVQALLDYWSTGPHVPFGPMVKTSKGYLQFFYYHNRTTALFTTDGITFLEASEVYYDATANRYGEPSVVKIDDDRLVILMRCNDPDNSFAYIKTSDGGDTFTAILGNTPWTTQTIDYGTPIRGVPSAVSSNILFAWGGRRPESKMIYNFEDAEAFWADPTIAWQEGRPNRTVLANSYGINSSVPAYNFGYPCMLPRSDGSFLITWYDQNPSLNDYHTDIYIATITE